MMYAHVMTSKLKCCKLINVAFGLHMHSVLSRVTSTAMRLNTYGVKLTGCR